LKRKFLEKWFFPQKIIDPPPPRPQEMEHRKKREEKY
jgi:hypothetical protein